MHYSIEEWFFRWSRDLKSQTKRRRKSYHVPVPVMLSRLCCYIYISGVCANDLAGIKQSKNYFKVDKVCGRHLISCIMQRDANDSTIHQSFQLRIEASAGCSILSSNCCVPQNRVFLSEISVDPWFRHHYYCFGIKCTITIIGIFF